MEIEIATFQSKIKNLEKNIDKFESKKSNIANIWINSRLVKNVLVKHDIDPIFFRDNYAIKVIDYFFGVVQGKSEIGSCPVIDTLLIYLKNKDITADELFMICTHARKAMLDVANQSGVFSYEIISEISYVFDLNFNGVLSQYSKSIYKLERKVELELEKNRQNTTLLTQQTRMAQMGEMISMIAHQWRQPLANIASIVIDINMKSEFKEFDLSKYNEASKYEKYVNKQIIIINEYVQSLTTIIDDFRSFYKPDRDKKRTDMDTVLSRSLFMIGPTLDMNNIKINITSLTKDYKDIYVYDNELLQVIINILKNASDNFLNRNIKNPMIHILVRKDSMIICDNGGGISEDIIDKIFDPYFSTKDEKNGTGLGLYMSKTIIEDHHKGSLNVFNKDDGVCFQLKVKG